MRSAGVVIREFFLEFSDLAIELVGEHVDRDVHVVLDRLGEQPFTRYADRCLGLVPLFLDRQDHVHVGDVIEKAFDLAHLLRYPVAQRLSDLDMVTGEI